MDKITRPGQTLDNLEENEQATRPSRPVQVSPAQQREIDDMRGEILRDLHENFPEPYSQDITFDEAFFNSGFCFREYMEDIFNFDRFLLLGGKGTGKTSFYRALKNELFFSTLQKRAQKQDQSFIVTNIISLPRDTTEFKFLQMKHFAWKKARIESSFFVERFWTIFTWNAVMLDSAKIGFNSSLEVKEINNDAATAQRFLEIINDTATFIKVEEELNKLDQFLREQDKYLILTFDQLDMVVKPDQWSNGIAPLLSYWREKRFNRIFGKLFIRRPLTLNGPRKRCMRFSLNRYFTMPGTTSSGS